MKAHVLFALVTLTTAVASAAERKETMCVRQEDGTYLCTASGKIEKEPCCATPSDNPQPKRKVKARKPPRVR
ncbi:MAG: hypothetical protein M3Z22_03880 [Verrucomicrobiota bacterium]|nr:hypothetical protein [Verrucomicrobiota bacterium]